jgi:hypothetical protein
MGAILATLAAIIGMPLLGIVLGLVQLWWYRLRKTPEDDIPFFLALVIRGMLVLLALIAVGAIASHLAAR